MTASRDASTSMQPGPRQTVPGWRPFLFALVLVLTALVTNPHGQAPAPLPTRGIEEVGRFYIGEPVSAYVGHLAMLFVTGKHPLVSAGTMQDTVDWVNDPLHSVVADGTGGLVVYAHPDTADRVLLLNNLTGMEVFHMQELPSASPYRDQMWDTVLSSLYSQGKPLIWGFAADDTHYTVDPGVNFDIAWNVALVPSMDLPSLKTAFRNGAFYTTNGPTISSVAVSGTTITLSLGQTSDVLWLRAGQYNTGGTFTQSPTLLGANTAVKIQQAVTTSTIDITSLGVSVADLHYVRAIVRTSPTVYALTQPFQVSSTGALSNPYPTTGLWLRGQTHNHDDAWIDNNTDGITTFRSNYQAVGQSASFETAYSYWEVPYQHLDSDGMPDLASVSPAKVPYGGAAVITVTGVNFRTGVAAQLGAYPLASVVLDSSTQLHGTVPTGIPAGVYDVVVTNPDHYRGTLATAVTVQDTTADNTGWTSYGMPSLPWNQTTSILSTAGGIWVGTLKGAAQYSNGAWSTYIPSGGLNIYARGIYDIAADSTGGMWFSSVGLWYRDPSGTSSWQNQLVNDPSGLSERWGKMAFDRSGQLWVTSRWGEGLAIRNTAGTWTRWTAAANGLPFDDNQAIACDYQGNIWVGFSGGVGIWKLNGSSWSQVAVPSGTSGLPQATFASALVAGINNDVWAAVQPMNLAATDQNTGVVHYLSDGTTQVFKTPQLPHPRITDILPASNGDVWFASRAGVARLSAAGQWQTFTSQNSGLVSNVVMAMAEGQNGTIWFATANGVSSYSPAASAFSFSLSSSGGVSVTAGTSGTSTISATLGSASTQPVSFTVTGLPAATSASFSQPSCSPTCSTVLTVATGTATPAGTYPLTVTGTASIGVQTTGVVLTVAAVTSVNSPPVVATPANQANYAGENASLQIAASDPNGDTLTYAAAGLPAGLTINTTTGAITGMVSATAATTNAVTVTVSDGKGGTASAAFSWTVVHGIVMKASQFVSKDATTSTLAVPRPSSVVAGNVMVVVIAVRGNPGMTVPSGWSQVNKTTASKMKQVVYWRVAGASEPSSYTWSISNNRGAAGGLLVYGGVDPSTPVDVSGGLGNGSSTLITAPSVTTKTANATLVGAFGTAIGTTIAPPAGMTERGEMAQTSGSDTITLEIADATWAAAAATGTRVATAGAAANNVGQVVALRLLTR